MKIGWGRVAAADRLLLLLLRALYLHFFDAHTRVRHFYFLAFFFFGRCGGHVCVYGRQHGSGSNYAMSTSGRAFKLALIKY